ncbi:MAG: hypothetical protein H6714_10635 [Myxococcales bacterium]|nr:hypothetical protein [Myxococcales bacterium]
MGVKKASLRLPKWVTIKNATLYKLDMSGRMIGFPIEAAEEVVAFEETIMNPQGPWSEVRRVMIDSSTGHRTMSTRYFAPTGQLQYVEDARGVMLADGFSIVKDCPWYTIEHERLVLQQGRIHHEFTGSDGRQRRFIEFFDAADDQSPFVLVGKDNQALGFMSRSCLDDERLQSQRLVMERRMRVHAVKHPIGWPVYPASLEDARAQVDAVRGQAGFVDWPFRNDPDLYRGPDDPFQEYCPGVTYPTAGTAGDIQNTVRADNLGVDDVYERFDFYMGGISDLLHQEYDKIVMKGGSGWAYVASWGIDPKADVDPRDLRRGICKAIKITMHCLWLRGFYQAEFYLDTKLRRPDPIFQPTVDVTNDWITNAHHNFVEVPLLDEKTDLNDLVRDPEYDEYRNNDPERSGYAYMLLQQYVPETNRRSFFIDLTRGFVCEE